MKRKIVKWNSRINNNCTENDLVKQARALCELELGLDIYGVEVWERDGKYTATDAILYRYNSPLCEIEVKCTNMKNHVVDVWKYNNMINSTNKPIFMLYRSDGGDIALYDIRDKNVIAEILINLGDARAWRMEKYKLDRRKALSLEEFRNRLYLEEERDIMKKIEEIEKETYSLCFGGRYE